MAIYTNATDFVNQIRNGSSVYDFIFTTSTEVRMKKTNNPYIGARKIQRVRVALNENYENRVNMMRMKEGKEQTFESEGLVWGHSNDNIIVEHNGQTYVKTIELEKLDAHYVLNGQEISYDLLRPFISEYSKPTKQGLEEEVKVRTFKLDSILKVEVNNIVLFERQ